MRRLQRIDQFPHALANPGQTGLIDEAVPADAEVADAQIHIALGLLDFTDLDARGDTVFKGFFDHLLFKGLDFGRVHEAGLTT